MGEEIRGGTLRVYRIDRGEEVVRVGFYCLFCFIDISKAFYMINPSGT